MVFKYKFALWLVDTLNRQQLTLKEIQMAWLKSSCNDEGRALTESSFYRYRNEVESLLNLDIKCNSFDSKYSVIFPEGYENENIYQWILSAFRYSALAERINSNHLLMMEHTPANEDLLLMTMEAIDQHFCIEFSHKSHFQEVAYHYVLIPRFVRLFRRRWYVVGVIKNTNLIRVFALERMHDVKLLKEVTSLPKSLDNQVTPENYFQHCFGVINREDPITIRFRAFKPEDAYLKDVPIHISQNVVNENVDYTDFEIYVKPTYDLKQELLWHRDKIAVLSPDSFKDEMIELLHMMLDSYKTGDNFSIDE